MIYVASSWRNSIQSRVVARLREAGLEVYDFKNPAPGNHGFSWAEIDPRWKSWTGLEFIDALEHRIAKAGFKSDMDALEACSTCILVLPCGRSAHLELGQASGAGKRTAILLDYYGQEPELMYAMVEHLTCSLEGLVEWARVAEVKG